MNIYDVLRSDHHDMRMLWLTIERMRNGQRANKFAALKALVLAHNLAEKAVFYHAIERDAAREVRENCEQHDGMARLMTELTAIDTDHPEWGIKFQAIKLLLEHHIERVEGAMFAVAQRRFSAAEGEHLAQRMQLHRDTLLRPGQHASSGAEMDSPGGIVGRSQVTYKQMS